MRAALVSAVRGGAWTIALRFLAVLVFLLLTLLPGASFPTLVLLFGLYAVVDGLLGAATGALALMHPPTAVLAFLTLMAGWAAAGGAAEIIGST